MILSVDRWIFRESVACGCTGRADPGCARAGPAAQESDGDGELPDDDGVDGAALDRTRGQAGTEGEAESDRGGQAEGSDDDADEADQPRLGSLSPVDAQDECQHVPAEDRQR